MAKVTFNPERCKGCELCIIFCPRKLLELSPHLNKQGYHPARMIEGKEAECTGCSFCARMCPDVAIKVEK